MLQQIFGAQLPVPVRVAVVLIVIAVLLGVTTMLLRRFSGGVRPARGRTGHRLSLIDSISLDPRRKLMLVRCDEMEHLLLVGGSNDVVVDADVGRIAADISPAQAAAAPAAAQWSEAPGREHAITREAPAPRLAPSQAGTLPHPEPIRRPEIPTQQDAKRPNLSRRPLLRGDGTVSGRPGIGGAAPARGVVSRTMPSQPAPVVSHAAAPAIPVLPDDARETEAPHPVASKLAPEAAFEAAESPAHEPEAPHNSAPQLDEMAQRLDAALADADDAPRISLSDLLDDDLAAEPVAEEPAPPPAPEPVAESAPAIRPVIKPVESEKVEPALETPAAERARPALADLVARDREAAGTERAPLRERPREVRPAATLAPSERPSRYGAATRRDASTRPELRATGSEPAMRPREFAFRTTEGPARPTREPPREPPRLEASRRAPGEPEVRPPEISGRDLPARDLSTRDLSTRDLPARDLPARDLSARDTRSTEPAARPEPVLSARRWEPPMAGEGMAPPLPAAPVVSASDLSSDADRPKSKGLDPDPLGDLDPLGDFDAEMANLLGRNTASGH